MLVRGGVEQQLLGTSGDGPLERTSELVPLVEHLADRTAGARVDLCLGPRIGCDAVQPARQRIGDNSREVRDQLLHGPPRAGRHDDFARVDVGPHQLGDPQAGVAVGGPERRELHRASLPGKRDPGAPAWLATFELVTWAQMLSFSAATMALLLFPGPSVLFVVSRGVALGRRAALATVAGNTMGSAVHIAAVTVGVGAVVARSAAVFTTMKVVGAAYLVWLGMRAVRHRHDLSLAFGQPAAQRPTRRLVRDGFVVGVTNPKTTLFFLAVLPQFVQPDGAPATLQLAVLGVVFCALALVNDGLYGVLAGSVRRGSTGHRAERQRSVGPVAWC